MKLYQFDPAPASRRVDIFLKEADVSIDTEQLNVRDGDQFKEPFNSLNPFHCVPFLELSDGTVISESVAICRYLEESNQGKINLFGSTPKDRALIEMWNRRLEIAVGRGPLSMSTEPVFGLVGDDFRDNMAAIAVSSCDTNGSSFFSS